MLTEKSLFFRIFQGDESIIAFVDGKAITAKECNTQVQQLLSFLSQRQEKAWLLWSDSPYFFIVQFCALCLSNKRIILPSNKLPENLNRISENVEAVLSQTVLNWSHERLKTFTVDQLLNEPYKNIELSTYLEVNPEIVLYTSGSTGEPKAVSKTLSLLFEEVKAQNALWGKSIGAQALVSTVSHQHIYGVLHSVLWPLYRGAAIVEPLPHLAEEIEQVAYRYKPCVLVSSPTHLKRLSSVAIKNDIFSAIFSSAGRLEQEDALSLLTLTGVAPFEIFGSTETGGVAWRQQSSSSQNSVLWTPLPGVKVAKEVDGRLKISSAYMQECNYVMSDCVDLLEGKGFLLRGRVDKVVKVEGKRLSIGEMEVALVQHDWIQQAKVLVVNFRREEVSVVAQLSASGQKALDALGKLSVNRQLKQHLAGLFEMPLLPRRWRYVEYFPSDSQGKVTHGLLKSLFISDRNQVQIN